MRSRLDILTAQSVLGIWELWEPEDRRGRTLLAVAEQVERGQIDRERAMHHADATRQWLDFEVERPQGELAIGAAYALDAIIEAVWSCAGVDRFAGLQLSDSMSDADLDPWTTDCAVFAAAAFAGPIWEPKSSDSSRLTFWHWWLREGIPGALIEAV